MEDGNSIIYGLENQTRALSPQYAESDAVRFLIGTQSLKPQSNQVHVVELEEDTGALHTRVFKHEIGEIWHLRCSPHDVATLMTTHNSYDPVTVQCTMGVSIFKLPTIEVIPKDMDELSAIQSRNAEDMEHLLTIKPEKPDEELRCAEWHPTDAGRVAVMTSAGARVYDGGAAVAGAGEGRRGKCGGGKWSPHAPSGQLAIIQDTHIRSYDLRSAAPAWSVEAAHKQLVRDIDFNPNRQFQLASVGDDGALNIWDYRSSKEPIFTRQDHSHWVWTVRYNTYHEQLLLTGSSDARALLTAAASVCERDGGAAQLEDGVLQAYSAHSDSVYCAEWSAADPWTFASLSYDARLVLSTVPRHDKYKILL